MSINTILSSDKANFQNYFPDGIVIPERANLALTQLGMDIPIIAQNTINIPLVAVVDRDSPALRVEIDGVFNDITWRNLYTAWTQYPDPAIPSTLEPNMTEDLFFGNGDPDTTYEFWLNNLVLFSEAPLGTQLSKPPIMWVIARAIENEFEYYSCRDITTYHTKFSGIEQIQTLNGAGTNYENCSFEASGIKKFGLNVSYNSGKVSAKTPTVMPVFQAGELNGFSFAGGALTSVVTAAPARVNLACASALRLDPNGGYIATTPDIPIANLTNNMAWGLSLEGQGNTGSDIYFARDYPTLAEASTIIDVGIQFETFQDNGGAVKHAYKIIDGQTDFVFYDGAASDSVTLSNFKPRIAMGQYTNGSDEFFILMRRGNERNNTSQYIFEIMQGTAGADIRAARCIYTARRYIDSADIRPTTMFISDNIAGNNFTLNKYLQRGVDSNQEGENPFDYEGGNIGTFKLSPASDAVFYDEPTNRDFWNKLGFFFATTGQENVSDTMNFKISTDGTKLNKTLTWSQGGQLADNSYLSNTDYFIGKTQLNEIYEYSIIEAQWKAITRNALSDLPKYLNVYITNQDIKSYSGSANFAGIAFTQQGEDRQLALVPFETDTNEDSGLARIRYESFNPYYRPLNNPVSYKINDLMIEISTHDPVTNTRYEIKQIAGILKMCINITKSVRPNLERITRHNDLVPII